MGEMRDRWRVIKKWTDDQIAAKGPNWQIGDDPVAIKALLKKFTAGLGPNLDKVESAYKANKGKDVMASAGKALPIAQAYLKEVQEAAHKHQETNFKDIQEHLDKLVKGLEQLKAKGMTAPPHLVG